MFHLFTLQGRQMEVPLEQLSKIQRVHQTKKVNRTRKFIVGESPDRDSGENRDISYAREAYKKGIQTAHGSAPVFHASEIMSSPVISISPETSAADAWEKFKISEVRHMLVLSTEGNIVGIVSDRDLLKHLLIKNGKIEEARKVVIGDIMATKIIAASSTTDIRRIAKAMMDHHIGTIPIVDEDGSPVGIVTKSDILHAIINHPQIKFWA